ncbi:hypothetical protein PGIGA_G00240040 [Pangasianodon gigas]|uniref:Uncharacterized protein n=1 Tax=Pangasianodon gigas TaxID=30993 RepID=A0ACC5WMU4_PANGG|nr:hypothetical protein [Pangasianodon gigas]
MFQALLPAVFRGVIEGEVVEIALKVSPVLASHMFQALLPAVFRGVIEGERYPVVMSTYLGIIGRLLLQNSSFFSSLLTQMAMEFNQEPEQLLGNLMEMWVDRMDNITQPERRKLSSLALLSLLPSDNTSVPHLNTTLGVRYPVVMSTYLGIIGRLLLQNSSFFSSLLTQMAMEFNQEPEQLLGNLMEMWVDRMDNITQPERRKLSSLALLSLLPSDNTVVQEKFCGIVNICVESLHDVMTEDPETGTFKDCMLVSEVEEPKFSDDEEPPTEQDKRRKLLALEDPVHTVSLQQCVYEKLKLQQGMMGDQGFQALMETVDTEIIHQLQEFLHGL